MIGLHAPFRRATPADARAIGEISKGPGCITSRAQGETAVENAIVGEDGKLFAVLAGSPAGGDAWQIDVLAVAPERSFDEFGPRLLAIADALAADEGLASVRLTVDQATDHVLAVLDQEGFRPDGQGAVLSMIRAVVPQG
jgi:hypothetical protein